MNHNITTRRGADLQPGYIISTWMGNRQIARLEPYNGLPHVLRHGASIAHFVPLAGQCSSMTIEHGSYFEVHNAQPEPEPTRADILAQAQQAQRRADKHTAERTLSQPRDAQGVTCSLFEDFTPTDAQGNRSLF